MNIATHTHTHSLTHSLKFKILPTSYPMGTGSSFPRDKAAGAWSWPLTSM